MGGARETEGMEDLMDDLEIRRKQKKGEWGGGDMVGASGGDVGHNEDEFHGD